jgi:hypothetical protein
MRRKTKKIPKGLEEIEISMKAIKAQRVGSVWMAVCEHIMTTVFSCGEWLLDEGGFNGVKKWGDCPPSPTVALFLMPVPTL